MTSTAWDTRTSNRDDQAEVIAFLADSATHHGEAVECVETHISIIFLAGNRAYKLKRAVAFDYLDFSTPERRRVMCQAEVRLNRRTAPAIYKGVLPITRAADGSLSLGGEGEPVDWVVRMARFDQSQLLDRLAQSQALSIALIDRLGRTIAAFHRDAAVRIHRGGAHGMRLVVDGNAHDLQDEALSARTRAELAAMSPLLEQRRRDGFVRECHGDLHLGNIVVIDGAPTLFDAIEFNDDFACTDVLYDLAFLIMDLGHRGLAAHANALWNAYLEETAEYRGLALMPLFLSCRAAVRAKISQASARVHHDAAERDRLRDAARHYLGEASALLEHQSPQAVLIGGPSGAGKSTVAAALAPRIGRSPGAVVLRSDVIRKQICGVDRLSPLGPDGYTRDVSVRVYRELATRARQVLDGGCTVIVDATFLRSDDRRIVESAIRPTGATCHAFWLDAPDAVLIERLRRRSGDPSDADATVLARQRTEADTPSWPRFDAEKSTAIEEILTAFRQHGGLSATVQQ